MDEEFSVVSWKSRGKKLQSTESSRLLSLLHKEGLRQQDLDADCRHFLETAPEDVKAKALSHFLDMRREKVINNPSAYLTTALINASKSSSPVKQATMFIPYSETSSAFCPSANHLLGVLASEGLKSTDLDPDCQLYMSKARPAAQTQALQDFLQQWRGGRIRNPSAYLTDLLTRAASSSLRAEHDALHFMDVPASVPRKVVPVVAPLPFVHANTPDISMLAANMKIDAVSAAISPAHSHEQDLYNSWPAVGVAEMPRVVSSRPNPVPENKVHDVILRYFAKQFIPMDRDELLALKMEDLETILNVQGESGLVAAMDQADENVKMMPLYDISDEAGQTELLLKELEYAAEVIVDILESSSQLAA